MQPARVPHTGHAASHVSPTRPPMKSAREPPQPSASTAASTPALKRVIIRTSPEEEPAMRPRPLWLSIIVIALAACGNDGPSEQPELYVDRDSLGFGQEFGTGAYVNQEITESLYIENQ